MKKKDLFLLLGILGIVVLIMSYLSFVKKDEVVDNNNTEKNVFDISAPADFDEYQIQRFNEQLGILKQMYAEDSEDAEFWIGLGNLYGVAENYQKSSQAYIKAGEIAPFNTISFANLAHLYEKEIQDYNQAEKYYEQAIKNNQNDAWLFIDFAKMYKYKLNNKESEEKIFLQGVELNPNSPDLLFALSRFYEKDNKIEKAVEYLERAVKASPQNNLYKEELERLKKE